QPEAAVGSVHQRIRTSLDLVRPGVERIGAGAAGRHQLTADVAVRGDQYLHGELASLGSLGCVWQADDMALVPHDASHRKPAAAGKLSKRPSVLRGAAAARQPDVNVYQDLRYATRGCRLDGLSRVDGYRDPRARSDQVAQAPGVQDLVRQQEI